MIDFAEADLFDRKWWRKLRLLLNGLERDNQLRWAETVHRHNTAVAGVPDLKPDVFEKASKHAAENLEGIYGTLFPYARKDGDRSQEIDSYRKAYVERFGDWQTDPAAKANLDRLVEFLTKRAAEGAAALARMTNARKPARRA